MLGPQLFVSRTETMIQEPNKKVLEVDRVEWWVSFGCGGRGSRHVNRFAIVFVRQLLTTTPRKNDDFLRVWCVRIPNQSINGVYFNFYVFIDYVPSYDVMNNLCWCGVGTVEYGEYSTLSNGVLLDLYYLL